MPSSSAGGCVLEHATRDFLSWVQAKTDHRVRRIMIKQALQILLNSIPKFEPEIFEFIVAGPFFLLYNPTHTHTLISRMLRRIRSTVFGPIFFLSARKDDSSTLK